MADQNVGAEAAEPSRGRMVLDVIRPVVMDIGMMNYVVLRVYFDAQPEWIKILRGYRRPEWTKDQITTPQQLPDCPDDFVTLRIDCELRPFGATYDVIGWGKLHHNARDRLVTFFEEEDDLQDQWNGHSEQCFLARELIKSWKVHSEYSSHEVLMKDVHLMTPFTN